MAYEYMGVTDIANVSQAAIASLVQDQLVESTRLLPSVMDYSALVMAGDKSVAIPRGSALSASDKSEGTEIVATHFTYAADAIALSSHKYIALDVEDIAKMQSKVALMNDLTARIGNGLADAVDAIIYAQAILPSASAPDHRIAYNDATNEDLEITDILEAKRLLEVQKVPKTDRFMLISPAQEKNMLKIDSFVEADKYGSNMNLLNGEIGRVYGFRVLVSNVFGSDTYSLFYHKSHVAFAKQQGVTIEIGRNIKNLSDIIVGSFLAGAKVMQGGLCGVRFEVTP